MLIIAAIALPILILSDQSRLADDEIVLQQGNEYLDKLVEERQNQLSAWQYVMLATLLFVVLVLIAAVTDATRHRIYNWTTYPGIIAGACSWAERSGEPWARSAAEWQPLVGWLAWDDAAAGFCLWRDHDSVLFVLWHRRR